MSDSEYSESFAGPDESEENGERPRIQQTHPQQQQQQHAAFVEFAASSSTSGGDSSVSSTSSEDDESDDNESDNTLELTKITSEVLSLPRGLCENPNIFHEFFSLATWQQLPAQIQNHLQQFLPNFSSVLPPQMAAVEKARTLSMLFTGELQSFGQSPLLQLQQQLESGNCRPDIKKLRENIKKSQRREAKFQNCERLSHMAKQLFLSRQRLMDHAHKSLPDEVDKAPLPSTSVVSSVRQPKPSHLYRDNKLSAIRARKRFYNEISNIAQELGMPDDVVLSADENDNDNQLNEEMRKDLLQQQRSVDENAEPPKTNISLAERCVYSTVFRKRNEMDDEDAFRLQQRNRQTRLTNRNFKEYLKEHKRRKLTEPTLPELETSDIRLRDVCARAQIGGNFKRILGAGKPGRKPKNATATSTAAANTNPTSENLSAMGHKQTMATLPVTQQSHTISQPSTPTSKLSEPPALVPIQPTNKKTELYHQQTTGIMPTAAAATIQQQQLDLTSFTKTNNNNHTHNTSNDSLNISSFISGHGDNLNLCMDDSSLLAGDHDAFNMLDNEVELQQEEVETFAGSSDDNLTNFVIGDDIVLGGSRNDNSSLDNGTRRIISTQQQPLPKLEPIMRSQDTSPPKVSLKTFNNQKSLSASSLPNVNCTSELIQETHASYFSLIRDFFCSTPNHRMRYDDLKSKIDIWLRNPITALNEWYAHADNWSNLLRSGINFLVGDFPDLPDEYVPYIEYKLQMNIYQWIGAGRDSDTRLTELCNLWMEKRKQPHEKHQQYHQQQVLMSSQQMSLETKLEVLPKSVIESEDAAAEGVAAALTPPPPPPRCPTNWTVRAATDEEIYEFQRQERERFELPHKAYTYCMFGYESVVGPVKGIYTPMLALAKARGHSMMVGDRPNFVTILTLVRDATARLPNGEGTRADISELLKCSQYINPDAAENVLQTIVSGALDRMHTEHDPCVRYDPKRKIWIYLHRNRTEEEFERIHQQNQTMGKTKKLQQRKPRPITAGHNKLNSPDQEMGAATVTVSSGSLGEATNGNLLTLPALVPANPIIVSNTSSSSSIQRQQQLHHQQQLQKQQQIQLNKCPPVPPLKYNIPPSTAQQMTTTSAAVSQQPQQKSLLKTTVRQENKTSMVMQSNKQHSFQVPQAKANPPPSNTTPIIVATPQGLQTVHVSNATSVVSSNHNNTTNQPQTAQTTGQQTNLTANLAGKRVMLNKPIIINQVTNQQSPGNVVSTSPNVSASAATKNKSPQQMVKQQNRITLSQQQQQQLQQQSNIITIPMSMANSININTTGTADHGDSSSHPPAHSPSLSGKQNIIRLLPGSNVKALLNSPSGQVINRQRIITTNLSSAATTAASEQRSNTQLQQQQKTNSPGFQLLSSSGNVVTINSSGGVSASASSSGTTTTGSIVKMSAQAFAALQQKQAQQQQQQQHIIVKQASSVGGKTQTAGQTMSAVKAQRVILGNTAVMGQSVQGKNIVLQQIPVGSSSSVVVTPTTSTTAISTTAALSGGNKIQTINTTNLTPQQQRILIQNLKQQQQSSNAINQNQIQFKTVQVVASNATSASTQQQQHSIIQRSPQTITMSAATSQQSTPKTMVMVSQDNGSQSTQNITRILKTSPQLLKSEAASNTTSRVITSSSGQIISLDSLIQKQGGALRITGAVNPGGTVKTNVHQQLNTTTILQKSQPQQQAKQAQQQQQYAIVSVPNSIISLGNSGNFTVGQRIITTQATSGGGSSFNTAMVNVDGTRVTPGIVSTVSGGQRRVVTTAGGTKILTKTGLTGATAGTSNIRVLNTVNQSSATTTSGNINMGTLQGKQVVLATGKTVTAINKAQITNQQQQQQNIVQTSSGGIVIGGQTIKLQQGSANVQHLLNKGGNIVTAQQTTSATNQSSGNTGQMQTVIMGNQILRVQQMPQIVTAAGGNRLTTNVINSKNISSSDTGSTSNIAPKTIFLGAGGQTLRLQPASAASMQTGQTTTSKNIIVNTNQQNTLKTVSNSSSTTGNRVVLAVQGGGQIFLSPNFQGGNINLKNLKMVSLAQAKEHHQQQQQQQQQHASSTVVQAQANILKISPSTHHSTTSDANA